MNFKTVNNVSILPKHLPSKEDPRHLVHYINQASASSQDFFNMNPTLGDCTSVEVIYDNIPTYIFNEA